jgi:hypothetical protein
MGEKVSADELSEWRANHVTRHVKELLENRREFLLGSFDRGELVDWDNPAATHGLVARTWGRLKEVETLINYLDEFMNPDPPEGGEFPF